MKDVIMTFGKLFGYWVMYGVIMAICCLMVFGVGNVAWCLIQELIGAAAWAKASAMISVIAGGLLAIWRVCKEDYNGKF